MQIAGAFSYVAFLTICGIIISNWLFNIGDTMKLNESISATSLALATLLLLVLCTTIFSDLFAAVLVQLLLQILQTLF